MVDAQRTVTTYVLCPAGTVPSWNAWAPSGSLLNPYQATLFTGVVTNTLTGSPPAGAGALSVSVTRKLPPGITVLRSTATVHTGGVGAARTTSASTACELPTDTVMTAPVAVVGAAPVTTNVPVVLPAGIVMLAGTVAAVGWLETMLMTAPPCGAAALSVTVAVVFCPTVMSRSVSLSR